MTTDTLLDSFQNPGAAWRGKPFWAWNGRLDKTELLRQVHVMHEMGLGGFFMHSRVGLETEYLGDDWFECINACADEAEKLGMEAWLYDEDRWPSGTAGGLVTANPDHRMRFLRLSVVPEAEWTWRDDVFAVFAAELDGLNYTSLRHVAPGSAIPPGFSVLVFTVEEMAASNFYNGYTYVDTMSRAATEAFLKSTHEKYVERCGDRLGKSIKGIFTDEPHRGSLMSSFGQGLSGSEWLVPWTPLLPDHWRDTYGDELLEHLPELFLWPDGEPIHPTKWRYNELCLQLFIENFCKPLDQWCKDHSLILTGHFLHEDNLTSQVAMNGSMMRCYEHMQWPGMDLLSEGNRAFWVAKQLQSAGRQLGRPWLMSELYGCTGWQMPLSGHKQVGDWQALFGVNVRCHHLSWYTMAGEAKRDYPASILHQSAWWRDYAAVETYFARLGFLLSQGEPVCDVLVIHPVESVWAQVHPGWCNGLSPKADAIVELERKFAELFHWLQGAQIDFDYGDEGLLAEHGKVFGTQSKASPLFTVGERDYETIIVAGLTNIRSRTLNLLEEFKATGSHGHLVFIGKPPTHVDGVRSERPARLAERCEQRPWSEEAIHEAFPYAPQLQIQPKSPSVFVQRRRLVASDGFLRDDLYVILNTDRVHSVRDIELKFRSECKTLFELDCLTGKIAPLQSDVEVQGPRSDYGTHSLSLSLQPSELRVILARKDATQLSKPQISSPETTEKFIHELTEPFPYSLDEPNVLVLDTATFSIDGEEVRGPLEILKIDQSVRRHFGLEVRGGEMVQPWYAEKFHGQAPKLGKLTLRFTFWVETLPSGPIHLAIERPDRYIIALNDSEVDLGVSIETSGASIGLLNVSDGSSGASIVPSPTSIVASEVPIVSSEVSIAPSEETIFWIDRCFSVLKLPEDTLVVGENVITLTTEFRRDSDLEAIYLLGEFGVRLDGPTATLVPLPETLTVGDVCEQGLPFYSGAITYHIETPEATGTIELPEIGGACMRIDGETIPWPPFRAPVTDPTTAVTVVLTRRNTFGPLHLVPKVHGAYGPGHWVTDGAAWSDDYQLFPAGLLAPPKISK